MQSLSSLSPRPMFLKSGCTAMFRIWTSSYMVQVTIYPTTIPPNLIALL